MLRLFDQGTKAFTKLAERSGANGQGRYSLASEVGEAAKSLGEVARQVAEPGKFAAAQNELFKDYAELWGRSVRRYLGEEKVEPVTEPEPGDNRFNDPEWSRQPLSSISGSRPISSPRAGPSTAARRRRASTSAPASAPSST